jgi:translation initiation factor eIF-2B subunit delta
MGNVIKEFKQRISQLRNDMSEEVVRLVSLRLSFFGFLKKFYFQLKSTLYQEIDNFSEEKVKLAGQTICKYLLAHEDVVISGSSYVKSKLTNNDCILIYGYSSLVVQVIREAHRHFKSLRVIVVDSRPKKSGRTALRELLNIGVDCTYIQINAVSFVMNLVTKVILGSHALLANGFNHFYF